MFDGNSVWQGIYVNCGHSDSLVADVCTHAASTYPASAAAFDGPRGVACASLRQHRRADRRVSGRVRDDAQPVVALRPRGDAPDALVQPARCDAHARLTKAPACLCTCDEKRAAFGFNVPKKK